MEQIQILHPFCNMPGFRLLNYIMAEVRDSSSLMYIHLNLSWLSVYNQVQGQFSLSLSVKYSHLRAWYS